MPYAGVAPVNAFLRDDPRFQDLLRRLNLPLGKANRGLSAIWEGFWEGFAANRCQGMQKKENGRVSKRTLLQRFAKESNEKQNLAENLKTAGSNPLGVELRLLTQPRSASQPSPPPSAVAVGLQLSALSCP